MMATTRRTNADLTGIELETAAAPDSSSPTRAIVVGPYPSRARGEGPQRDPQARLARPWASPKPSSSTSPKG